jgi:hypothetical protein
MPFAERRLKLPADLAFQVPLGKQDLPKLQFSWVCSDKTELVAE